MLIFFGSPGRSANRRAGHARKRWRKSMRAYDVMRKLMGEKQEEKKVVARELLERDDVVVGDVIEWDAEEKGVVIEGDGVREDFTVNGKAILLTHYSSGVFWGIIATERLNLKARLVRG